jgi:hypothetical protein
MAAWSYLFLTLFCIPLGFFLILWGLDRLAGWLHRQHSRRRGL